MSAFQNVHSSASSALIKLLSDFDPSVKSVADLKSGTVLLKLFLEIGLAPQKAVQNVKNPFHFMKKNIKKSSEKEFFHGVNLDQCDKGNEAELLYFCNCLLYRFRSQQKENLLQASNKLSDMEAKILRSVWQEMEPSSFKSEPSRSSLKVEPLKEFNFSPKAVSPHKRVVETPHGLKKEIQKKEICITNLRSLLDEEQERIIELLQTRKDYEHQISVLEKVVKDQRGKLAAFNEASKVIADTEELRQTIQSLTMENEKLLLKVRDLKDARKEVVTLEAENQELQNMRDTLDTKVANLEGINKKLNHELKDWQNKQCTSDLMQQHLDILHEELKVKEDTISELNNMIAVYQDKLDLQKMEQNTANMDLSDCGEIVGLVCSSFQNTSCELSSLQNEVNTLQHQKDILESDLQETKESLQKSTYDNSRLEKEVDTLQKIVEHLNTEVKENQVQISNLDKAIDLKDCSIADLTLERNNLVREAESLISQITEIQDQLVKLKDDQVKLLSVIEEHKEEVQRGRNEIGKLLSEMHLTCLQKNELLEQVSSLEAKGQSLQQEVSAGNTKIETLFSQLQELENKISRLKLVNSEQTEMVRSLKEDKADLESALETLQEKYGKLLSSYDGATFEKEELVSELRKLHGDYLSVQTKQVSLQSHLNSLTDENTNLEKKIHNVSEENHVLSNRVENMKTENSSLCEELKQLQTRVSVMQNDNSVLQTKVGDLLTHRIELQKNISELKQKNEDLTANYSYASKTIGDLSLQLKSAQNELVSISDLHSEIECNFMSLRNDHGILQEKYHTELMKNQLSTEEVSKLQEQCSLANKNIQDGENRIMELNNHIKMATETNNALVFQNKSLTEQKSISMEKSVKLEQEVSSLQQMKNILTDQITELLNEKILLQTRLKQSEERVDVNTSACSFSMADDDGDDNNLDLEKSVSLCYEKDVVIKNLEAELSSAEESYKVNLRDKTNENAELLKRVESLLLDLKSKEKYMVYLESEKQLAFEKLTSSLVSFENRIEEIHNNHKKDKDQLNKEIEALKGELNKMTLLKENGSFEILEYKESLSCLSEKLDITLAEKSEIISVLCEREEVLKGMQQSLNENRLTNTEMAAAIEDKEKMVKSLKLELDTKVSEIDSLSSDLNTKEAELNQVRVDFTELKNLLASCEERYVNNLDLLRKEKKHYYIETTKLNDAVTCKDILIDDLSEKILQSSRANDLLVAETVQKAKEVLSLQKSIKESYTEIQNLKMIIASHEQNESILQESVQNANAQMVLLQKREADQNHEIEDLRCKFLEGEQFLKDINEKLLSLENVQVRNQELRKRQEILETQIKDYENEITHLKNLVTSLSKSTQGTLDNAVEQQKSPNFRKDVPDENNLDLAIHNPALKQWLDQFDSLSEKIQEMKIKYPKEVVQQSNNVTILEVSTFENEILTMIRNHIHSWFSRSEFLLQGEKNVEVKILKGVAEQLTNESMESKVPNIDDKSNAVPVVKEKPCEDCLTKSDVCLKMEKELKQKLMEVTAAQEKLITMEKKYETKGREATLYKEAFSNCQQKLTDLKQYQEKQQLKYRDEAGQMKEQNSALQTKLEAEHTKLRDMEKMYLEEMKVVHKKYQEKIIVHNTTSKELSHTKMQLVTLGKQHSDLLELYKRCEGHLNNANNSLKKQRLENENLKAELQSMQRTVQQSKQKEYAFRRMSLLPNTSFMQSSFCSSGDTSLDSSVFIKPIVPPSHFACDEEEGQFLDQSRNVSVLKEGRVEQAEGKGRLQELQRRNTLCKPHLRTHYPVETQSMMDESSLCIEELTRTPQVTKKLGHNSTSSLAAQSTSRITKKTAQTLSSSLTVPSTSNAAKAVEGQRKRREASQVPEDMSTPAKKTSTVVSQQPSSTRKNLQKKAPFYKVFSPFRRDKPKNTFL